MSPPRARILDLAKRSVPPMLRSWRARGFQGNGIKPLDALHLASAVKAEADYFSTCDDQFLKRARALPTAPMKVVSPLELITEIAS
jgi:hypothetical protein